MMNNEQSVLILGGGINGAAIARELVLNDVSVVLVDIADIAAGATAYSSRLIHGGLRYLEYGEFNLVNESLAERTRLLELAPDFVAPLRLHIPVAKRFSGVLQSTSKFLGIGAGKGSKPQPRGLHLVQVGLWFYDTYARDKSLPPRATNRVGADGTPRVNADAFRWTCSYSDAQIMYPERFVGALLQDAQEVAREKNLRFEVHTYRRATLAGTRVSIQKIGDPKSSTETITVEPTLIVNATGAWVDETLARLDVSSERLMGGTKGSHFVTRQPALLSALNGDGIYAEAADGRPIFVLPFGDAALIGTTDIHFTAPPESATATPDELDYLLSAANHVFPDVDLQPSDIELHYAGVRPLPFADEKKPSAVTRRHSLHVHEDAALPMISVVGGKLTTCRSLAEEATTEIMRRLGRDVVADSRTREIPERKPDWRDAVDSKIVLAEVVRTEWPTSLEDLVERRLMLLYDPELSTATLRRLHSSLVAANVADASDEEVAVERCRQRLLDHFGKRLIEN